MRSEVGELRYSVKELVAKEREILDLVTHPVKGRCAAVFRRSNAATP